MEEIHYSMIIQWDDRDNIFVVTVPELPGCMTHGKTYEEAVQQGKDAIESWLMVSRELGTPIPLPQSHAYRERSLKL
jgi:predicted RNase H-like HicB family nuclease